MAARPPGAAAGAGTNESKAIMSNAKPIAFLVDANGVPLRQGIVVDSVTGAPTIVTINPADGSVVQTIVGSGGGGAFATITGQPTDNANLATVLNAKLNIAPGWDGTTPALASGVNPITAGFGSNAFVYTGAGTSPALDGVTGVNGDTFIFGFGGASTWTKFSPRTGLPVAFATGHTFVDADDTSHVIATGTPAYTLPTGRAPGWGVSIDGPFTLAGGGLTIGAGVTDGRSTTGVAFCSLVQTDTSGAGATYKLVGTK